MTWADITEAERRVREAMERLNDCLDMRDEIERQGRHHLRAEINLLVTDAEHVLAKERAALRLLKGGHDSAG